MKVADLITDIRYGYTGSATSSRNEIGFIRVTDIDENGLVNYDKVPGVSITNNEANRYLLEDGDCIIARSGSVGKAHIYKRNSTKNVFASYLIRLRFDKTKINPKYFGAFARSKYYWNQIDANKQGGVQQNINTDGLSRIDVPLPDLKTQQKIAGILEQVDAARQKRKQANQLTEQFLQSAFLEMFGDPVRNEKGWEVRKIRDVAEVNPRMSDYERNLSDDFKVSFIPMAAVDDVEGRIVKFDNREISTVKKGFTYFIENDVLLAKITPCMENGKAAIARGLRNKVGFGSTEFHIVRCGNKIVPEYIYSIFRMDHIRNIAAKNMTGSAGQQRVPSDFIKNFQIPLPPIALQNKYRELLIKVEQLRNKQRSSEIELNTLFNSLMQKYFG